MSASLSPSSLRGVLHHVSTGSTSLSLIACSASFLAQSGAGSSSEGNEVPWLAAILAFDELEALRSQADQIDELRVCCL